MKNRETITIENVDTKLLDFQRGAILRATEGKPTKGDKELLEGALNLLTEMADKVYFKKETESVEEVSESQEIESLKSKIKKLEEEKVKREAFTIAWGVPDFKHRAAKLDGKFDETKFEGALLRMISKHDACNGVTWETIDIYLEEYCKK